MTAAQQRVKTHHMVTDAVAEEVLMSDWLSIMPSIPLARSVPIVVLQHEHYPLFRAVALSDSMAAGSNNTFAIHSDGPLYRKHRVDLDDPQGFGYALRWLAQQEKGVTTLAGVLQVGDGAGKRYSYGDRQRAARLWLFDKHLHGADDIDRVALAKAIAEVTR